MSDNIELVIPTTDIKITKELGGVEDLLLDASDPQTVEQIRAGEVTTITKININTIPYKGKLGGDDFISVKEYIDSLQGDDKLKGFILTVGDGGVTWSGGVPANDEIAMAQLQADGTYRWLGKTTIGSDNWQFRGRVKGVDAVEPNEFITKRQGDEYLLKDDANKFYNQVVNMLPPDTEGQDVVALRDSNDTTSRIWSAKELKDFCPAPTNPWGDDMFLVWNRWDRESPNGLDRTNGWFGKKQVGGNSYATITDLDKGFNTMELLIFVAYDTDRFRLTLSHYQDSNWESQVLIVNDDVVVDTKHTSSIIYDKPIKAGTFISYKASVGTNSNSVQTDVNIQTDANN